MFHTNQLQALFDQLEALQQFDLEILPADLKAGFGEQWNQKPT
ncbi:hypothetical protein [Pseudomonas aeruginosa]|nr:hypothetical protein [Pseudomonas aeruginosa]